MAGDDGQATDLARLALVYARGLMAADEAHASELILSSTRDSFSSSHELAGLIGRHSFHRGDAAVRFLRDIRSSTIHAAINRTDYVDVKHG
jgi:hypothetical protein